CGSDCGKPPRSDLDGARRPDENNTRADLNDAADHLYPPPKAGSDRTFACWIIQVDRIIERVHIEIPALRIRKPNSPHRWVWSIEPAIPTGVVSLIRIIQISIRIPLI